MPQKTNLNSVPYFDDFDINNNFYKVLFKPGYPLQARELTTLQSILQNQIEQFGDHFFKEGSIVIPGAINYNNEIIAVRLQNQFNGIDIFSYIPYIVGTNIRGRSSGVRAYVVAAIDSIASEKNSVTLYLRFLDSDYQSSSYSAFINGEELIAETTISDVNFLDETKVVLVAENESFAAVETSDSIFYSSLVTLTEGVFYLRGHFVSVDEDVIILDQYSNKPSFKIGLRVKEEIITSDDDETLYDNSQGFSNYSAPGADRLKITATLDKIQTDDEVGTDFIQLLEVKNGELISIVKNPQYNLFLDELARRTYETNGDYYVNPPSLQIRETLNDFNGNNGIFPDARLTYNNNVASESLGSYQLSPLKAYINGYEVSTISPTFLDFEKPRTIKLLQNQELIYNTGSTFSLNRVSGSPRLGLSTSYSLSLRDSRVNTDSSSTSPGKEIGISRVYDFALESGSYNSSNSNLNEWDISLYDTQLYTEITLNSQLDSDILYNTPCQVKGKSSGAKGYLRYDGRNSGIITAYNTSGSFVVGEKLIFNGIENNRVSIAITQHTLDEVKSLFGRVGTALTFSADTKQYVSSSVGLVNISAGSGGISTVTSSDYIFAGNVKIGSLVSYTNSGLSTVTYSKVASISQNSLTIVGVATVTGICDGSLPASSINPSDFRILTSSLQKSISNTLYTKLPKNDISEVNLDSSDLIIRKEFDVTITSNSTGPITAESNEAFLPFDEERYVLTTASGINEPLTEDKFSFTSGGSVLTINGLSATSSSGCKLIATLRKSKVKSKTKNRNKVAVITINKSKYAASGIGATTLNDGLVYGNYPYGTRVQDEDICLLKPEVTNVFGVFESQTTTDAVLPNIVLSSLDGITNSTADLLVGEEFIGEESSTIAVYVSSEDSTKINYVPKNANSFTVGEKVLFKESGISAIISNIGISDNNISNRFVLENGQSNTILDYCKLVRTPGESEPIRSLKVVYEFASYSDSDSGDITTANSYSQFDYCDLDVVNGDKVSDIIDIRPRVSDYVVAENASSPFEFSGRSFTEKQNSSKNILASDESFALDYSFYLPRIDKIFLSKDGIFQISKGQPSEFPQPPSPINNTLEVATVFLPAYLCNVSDADIKLTEHRRYTMFDIRKLEDRIKNLEYYTSLSFLESGTTSLQIKDSGGLDRKKLGIFVDDFSDSSPQEKITIVKNSFDSKNSELRPSHYTTFIDLILGYSSIISSGSGLDPTADLKFASDFNGNGMRKTGSMLTLDYTEVLEIDQPYSTRVVSVAPFRGTFYSGSVELTPSSDVWVDQVKLDTNSIEIQGSVTKTPNQLSAEKLDPQVGYNPVEWSSWSNQWNGKKKYWINDKIEGRNWKKTRNPSQNSKLTGTSQRSRYNPSITTQNGISVRELTREVAKESFDNKVVGEKLISTAVIPYMRSRNIEFSGKKLKPFTRVYSFFDGIDMSSFVFPKLLEIQMTSGVFQVGETVIGYNSNQSESFSPIVRFRISQQNHKYGPYNDPSDTYILNPYIREQFISPNYSSTSTILNIDTYSLSNKTQGQFYGNVRRGIILRGESSGASAVITDVRLITDEVGSIIGSIFIPDPSVNPASNPSFRVGTKLFRLTDSSTNSQIEGVSSTSTEKTFFAEGTINNVQENTLVVENPTYETQTKVETTPLPEVSAVASSTVGYSSPTQRSTPTPTPAPQSPPTPQTVPLVKINRGGPVYGNSAQNRLVAAYNQVYGTNVKTVEQVARKLDVNITQTSSGNLTQQSGNKIVKQIKQGSTSQGLTVNIAANKGTKAPASAITAAPKGTVVVAASPKNTSKKK
jgi:hypothetical protein